MKSKQKPHGKRREYGFEAPFEAVDLEATAQSNGVVSFDEEIASLVEKIKQLSERDRKHIEAYIDGMLAKRSQ